MLVTNAWFWFGGDTFFGLSRETLELAGDADT